MLNPSLLLFLPLALAPVILHLITLHRLRTVELPTFRFLMDSYLQQRRRARLLEWLLMLLRTAFVALVIVTLCRPVLETAAWFGGQQGGRDLVLIIDTGASMGLNTAGTTSLQRACAAAKAIINLADAEDRITIIAAAQQPRVLVSRFANDKPAITRQLDELKPAIVSSNLAAALHQALGDHNRRGRIVYLMTDGNRPGWASLQRQPVAALITSTSANVCVLDVGPREPVNNVALLGEAPSESIAVAGLPVLLKARVANQGAAPIDTVLSVVVDDQTVAQHNLSLQPGQVLEHPLAITPGKPGMAQVRLELPADAFPDDDRYLLTLNVERKLSVLIVRPDADASNPIDAALYLQAALRQGPNVEVRSIAPTALNTAMLADADVVIVSDVPLDEERGRLLRAYAAAGGGLLIFPGPRVQPQAYRQFLFDGKGANVAPLPLQWLAAVGDPDDESGFVAPTVIDVKHPVLSAFAEPSANYFSSTRLFRWFPLEVAADAGAAAHVLMRLPDRTPLLVESAIGPGKLLVAGFAATPQWSNLPLKPQFVPLVLRSVAHLRRPPRGLAPSAVRPGQPAVIAIHEDWAQATVEVIDPDGRAYPMELHRDQGRRVGAALNTQTKGFYRFRVTPPASQGPQEDLSLGFAVNHDLQEHQLVMLDQQAMHDLLGVPAAVVRSTPDDPTLASQLARRRELWRTMIWLAFSVIALEFVLSTLRAGPRAQADAAPLLTVRRAGWFDRVQGLAGQRWAAARRSGSGKLMGGSGKR